MPSIRPIALVSSSLLRKACTAPGTSRQLPSSASARVAASLQKHTERINKARQQAAKPSCRPKPSRSPVVAARQTSTPVILPPSLSASFASCLSSFRALSLRTTSRPQVTGSRIPLPTGARRPANSSQHRSCIRDTTLGRSSKRVHFQDDLITIAEIRFYQPVGRNDPFIRDPSGHLTGARDTCMPHQEGPAYLTRISRIPTRHGVTLGKQFQLRHDGFCLAPSRETTKGPDFKYCPYCLSNAAAGSYLPDYPDYLDFPPYSEDKNCYSCFLHLDCEERLRCEDHDGEDSGCDGW